MFKEIKVEWILRKARNRKIKVHVTATYEHVLEQFLSLFNLLVPNVHQQYELRTQRRGGKLYECVKNDVVTESTLYIITLEYVPIFSKTLHIFILLGKNSTQVA